MQDLDKQAAFEKMSARYLPHFRIWVPGVYAIVAQEPILNFWEVPGSYLYCLDELAWVIGVTALAANLIRWLRLQVSRGSLQ